MIETQRKHIKESRVTEFSDALRLQCKNIRAHTGSEVPSLSEVSLCVSQLTFIFSTTTSTNDMLNSTTCSGCGGSCDCGGCSACGNCV